MQFNFKKTNRDYNSYWESSSMAYIMSMSADKKFSECIKKYTNSKILILGVANDVHLFSSDSKKVVGVNISIEQLKTVKSITHNKVDVVLCDAHFLPFRIDSFNSIFCKSTLHHLTPVDAIKEVYRVLELGGSFVLYEPGLLNPIAMLGRLFFRSSIHVDAEQPFIWNNLRSLFKNFKSIEVFERFLLFSQLIPILGTYFKPFRKKRLLFQISKLDGLLCKTILAEFAWVGVICAIK